MTDQANPLSISGSPALLLRTPSDVVEAIPYLLGFHPTDSLVGLLVHAEQSSVSVAVRYDLPRPDAAGAAEALGRHLMVHASAYGTDRVVVVVFAEGGPGGVGLPLQPMIRQVLATLRRAGVAVADALHVSGGRCWSYLCTDASCSAECGEPAAAGPDPSAVAAAAVRAGLVALPSRAALAEALAPATGADRDAMERALGEAEARFIEAAAAQGMPRWRAAAARMIARAIEESRLGTPESVGAPALGDRAVAEILVALSDTAVRDDCWLAVEKAAPGSGIALWRQLVRRAVPPYDVAPLFLLGWEAWRRGDGVLARLAAERALTSDAGYRAASLLLEALDAGVDPRWLPALELNRGSRRRRIGGER